jgi:hypothetical protein
MDSLNLSQRYKSSAAMAAIPSHLWLAGSYDSEREAAEPALLTRCNSKGLTREQLFVKMTTTILATHIESQTTQLQKRYV